ncbi:oligosaccharide flippase family protein [Thiofilum flexile]|uniref:oligosaccharide flippase family protein n=1 Tax=Thiofilum flexile TaxID=125627 RepID=UPI000381CCF3|nr:oligosaccharide flippase family protein [Thiofilum flexile]
MKLNLRRDSLLIQSLLSTVARFVGVGLNFAVAILIARLLPKNEAGMVFMLMTLVTGVSLFSRLGLEQWIVRDIARLPDHNTERHAHYLHSAYRLTLLSSIVFLLIWIVLAPYINQWLFDGQLEVLYLMAAGTGIITFNWVMTNSAFLKAVRHTSSSLLVQNTLPAIALLLLIGLWWGNFAEHQHYVLIYTASLFLAGIISFFWLKPWLRILFARSSHQFPFDQLLKQSLPLAPVSMFAFLMLWADTLMTGLLLTNDEVALFSTAARLSFISLFFLGALDATIYPRLLKMQRQQPHYLKAFFWKSTLLVIGILSLVTLALWLVRDWMLLAFGSQYVAASFVLSLLLLGQLIRACSLTFSFMFIMQEQVRFLNLLLVTALIVNIISHLILIPKYGINGAAMATLIANLVLTGGVVILFFYKQLLKSYA